jgi:sugar (pentulose or hexulose) kinase
MRLSLRGGGSALAARHSALVGLELTENSVTSVVTDLTGWVLAKASAPVAVSRPRPGWVEANPHDWLAAAILTIRRTVHEAGVRPHAIGLCGQPHGLVLVDSAGVPVRPAILRPDARAVLGSSAYRDLPDRIRRCLANPLNTAGAGPLLSWILAHEPASYARTRWVLQPKDWLRAQLTGEFQTEPSDASSTLLYDFLAGEWSLDTAERLGLDHGLLPEILPGAGHQAGLLTRSGADMIGLRAGTPVAAGAARAAAAALGAGLADGKSAQIVLGTCPRVLASIPALPESLPLTGSAHIVRAATDRGWCITATVADHGQPTALAAAAQPDTDNTPHVLSLSRIQRFALDISAAVRLVTALAPVTRLQVCGPDTLRPGLLDTLAGLVNEPVHTVDPLLPVARAAALLGARAASLLDEETLVAQFSPFPPARSKPRSPTHSDDHHPRAEPKPCTIESNRRKLPDDSLTVDASNRRRSQPGERGKGRIPRTRTR